MKNWTMLGVIAIAATAGAQVWNPIQKHGRGVLIRDYRSVIERVANMVNDEDATRLTRERGLSVLNLTWEDTGRYKNSSVGPNISDMTIQVGLGDSSRAMPVIRYPNFEDKTTDMDPRDFTLLVGNERGRPLQRVSLYDYLESPADFLSRPNSWRSDERSLLADRDDKVLVSAQACFLPIPQSGKATFNPVLFNYQSESGNPAVLTIMATREGTSTTIIDNKRDSFREGTAWGQRLFFNRNGQRASLTGERMSDFRSSGRPGSDRSDDGLSMVLLIQVPLKHRERVHREFFGGEAPASAKANVGMGRGGMSDVETAVIGSGRAEGPFTEMDNLAVERDPRYPVRVTVQFYKATSNGVIAASDVAAIKQQIDWVYANGDAVGSLVTEGQTGRPTEYTGMKVQPRGWWQQFWQRYERNTGESREEAIAKLHRLLSKDYERRPVCELYIRDLLRRKEGRLGG